MGPGLTAHLARERLLCELVTTMRTSAGMAYREYGASSADVPVVLVHGMGGDSGTWERFARTLTDHGRYVIAPDLRGHGRSARAESYRFAEFGEDLVGMCDRLGFDRVDMVGHSLGGHAATVAAQNRPDLVRRLVVEEAPIPLRPGDPEQVLAGKLPSVPELWHATTSLIRHPRAVFAFDRSMTGTALEQFRRPDPGWWEKLTAIRADMLVLHGNARGMVDRHRLAALARAIPRCRVESFSCGHSIHRDSFREFTAVTLPFLMTAQGAAADESSNSWSAEADRD